MEDIQPIISFEELQSADISTFPQANLKFPKPKGCTLTFKRSNDGKISIKKEEKSTAKTLVCHDMKGGYLEDKFTKGCYDLDQEPYTFIHWSKIDTFIYFSHHFITIPPIGWIEAGHKNGVSILGTIITEFDAGAKIWKTIFSSSENTKLLIQKCVKICQHVGFDGWLLNIENVIDKENIEDLKQFVQELTGAMHAMNPDSKVLWYDSVTVDGKLEWQNALNDLNSPFFALCDGIFLNYTWTEETLGNSVLYCPDRRHDIYVGIDVFGRGCPGGGGFNTNKAMTMIKYHGLSSAIFAPGWTHECCQIPQDFENRDTKFWNLLQELVFHRGLLIEDDFETDLNPGSGFKNDKYWLDLSHQSIMPCFNTNYELICDIGMKEGKILKFFVTADCLDGNPENLMLELIFDEQDEMIQLKCDQKLEKTYEFICNNLCDRKRLHFIKISCVLACFNISNFKMSFIEE